MYNTLYMRNNNCNNNKNNSASIKCYNISVIEQSQSFSFLWARSNGNLQQQQQQQQQKSDHYTTTTPACLSCSEKKKTVKHLAFAGKDNQIHFTYTIGNGVNAFRSNKHNRLRYDPQRHIRHDNVHSSDNLISFIISKNMQNKKSAKNLNEKLKLNKEIIKHNLNWTVWENSKANLHRQAKEDFYLGQSTSTARTKTTKHFSLLSQSPSQSPSPSTKSLFSSLFLMHISSASHLPNLPHQPSAQFASLPKHINQPATLLQVPTSQTAKPNSATTPLMPSTSSPSHLFSRIFKRESKTTRSPFTPKPTKRSTSTELLDFITEVYDIFPNRTTTHSTRRRTTKRTFWQIYGRILLIAFGVSASIACTTVGFIIVYRFCRTTDCRRLTSIRFPIATNRPNHHQLQRRRRRRNQYQKNSRKENQNHTSALALPITLLPEPDQSLLPIEPEHSVSMLSVQTAGYAGMERLGVPTRTSLNTPPDEREQYRCRMRVDALQARELLAVRSETVIRNSNNSSIGSNKQHHHKQQQQQQHSHQQQQQQQQRMTSLGSSSRSSCDGSECQPPNQQHGIINNNSINNDSDNIVTRIGATPLKFDNTDSESFKGGGDYGSTTGSLCSSTSSANSHSIDHHLHYQQQLQQQLTPRCPHHIPLPDSEYGQDRHLQIRTTYQQSEITRSYTKPPPNKTVRDVPTEQLQSCYRLSSPSLHAAASNAGVTYPGQLPAHGTTHQQQTSKSKANPISKFFSRISSPKSPTTLALSGAATSSAIAGGTISLNPSFGSSASISSSASSLASGVSSSNVSSSSSASSLAAAPLSTLPISNAASLKSTACSYGAQNISAQDYNTTSSSSSSSSSSIAINNHILAGLVPMPSTQITTSFGTPATAAILDRMPTPPLSVSVPIALHQHYQQQQQFEQPHSSNAAGGLQIMKSSSCNLPPSHLLSGGCDKTDEATPPISRNNSSSSMMSCTCNCNSKNCNHCPDTTTTTTTTPT